MGAEHQQCFIHLFYATLVKINFRPIVPAQLNRSANHATEAPTQKVSLWL
jgi:hypothetical protein